MTPDTFHGISGFALDRHGRLVGAIVDEDQVASDEQRSSLFAHKLLAATAYLAGDTFSTIFPGYKPRDVMLVVLSTCPPTIAMRRWAAVAKPLAQVSFRPLTTSKYEWEETSDSCTKEEEATRGSIRAS